jgi:hypothetical protein
MAERVDDAPDPPPVLLAHSRREVRTLADGGLHDRVGIGGHEEKTGGSAAGRPWAQSLHAFVGGADPEHGVPDNQLSDDVIALPDAMQNRRRERSLVEGDRGRRPVYPQLRLNARPHPIKYGPDGAPEVLRPTRD